MNRLRILLLGFVTLSLVGVSRPLHADTAFALRFDGASDYVTLGSTLSIIGANWQTTKAVSLWLKPAGTPVCTAPETGTCDAIFGDKPRTWGISRGVIGGLDRIWVWNYDGTFDRIGIEYTLGEWISITLVHAGGELRAYRNGQLVGATPSGPTPEIGGQGQLHLGGIITNATRNWTFEGEIDELQIWHTPPSEAQILQGQFEPISGSESGLAAYYRMTNGSGTTLTDDSGHGWTGTLVDGGTGVPADGPIQWVSPGIVFGDPPPINVSPVADAQDVMTAEDTPVAIVLTGSDEEEDPLTFHVVTPPSHGALSGAAPNLLYTPAPNFNGADAFTFVVNDGFSNSTPKIVTLAVTPVDDPPVAVDDLANTEANTPVDIDVLDNDFDIDGDLLTIAGVDDPAHGIAIDDGQRITYLPDPDFIGIDTFTYTITDGYSTAVAQVSVNVTPPGEGPGYALQFDGSNDFVVLAETANIMAVPTWLTTKTVEVWVRLTGTSHCTAPTPANCDSIVGDRPRWWGISRGNIDGTDRVWIWNWDGNLDAVAVDFTPGEWMHLALVHAGGMLSAYKNGVLIGTVASGATQQPFTGALPILQLGGVINTAVKNWTFSGELDEVRVWNTQRTAQELVQHMNGPLQGVLPPGLAAYYRMTDGAGEFLTDDSGNGWIGKLHDGSAVAPPDGPIQWVPSGAFTAP